MNTRVLRSWPWTAALAAPLSGLVLLSLVALSLRTGPIALVVAAAAVAALARVLSTGVQITPSGLVIRELTRTTRVPWTRVRGVTSRPTERSRVHAPVLLLAPAGAVKGARRGRASDEALQVRILASYRQEVAQRRADELAKARAAATNRAR